MPQGSVPGPRKCCLYPKPIDVIYIDDTHVYVRVVPNETGMDASAQLEACLADICGCVNANMLVLNREKTELIILKPETSVEGKRRNQTWIPAGENVADCAKNLDVYFDTRPTVERQVHATSSAC